MFALSGPALRSNCAFTSAESKSEPSWYFTPCSRLNVYVVPSSEIVQDFASMGWTSPPPSSRVSPSKMLYSVTWLMAAAAPVVGSRPGAGSRRMPMLTESLASTAPPDRVARTTAQIACVADFMSCLPEWLRDSIYTGNGLAQTVECGASSRFGPDLKRG